MFVPASSGGVDVGDIQKSLRFRSGGPTYLSRQNGGADTNRKSAAIFFMLKPAALSTASPAGDGQHLFMVANAAPGTSPASYMRLLLTGPTRNTLVLQSSGSAGEAFTSSGVFADPNAWYPVLLTLDNAGTSVKCYVGPSEIAYASRTNPTNTNGLIGAANYYQRFGMFITGDPRAFNGGLARFCYVDGGGALTPSSFIRFNAAINAWVIKPQSTIKAVVDAGGAGSYMLDFDDGTSLTTLGYDKSSKGNNWTLNNFSLTPGATYDWLSDVPGNSFATLNPLDINLSFLGTYSDGNLKITAPAGQAVARGSIYVTEGKWYFEALINSVSSVPSAQYVGVVGNAAYYAADGTISGCSGSAGASYTTNDVIGVAFDRTAGTIEFFKNGTTQGGVRTITAPTGEMTPYISTYNSGPITVNFGQRPFAYAPPTNYKAMCQANLPSPAVPNPRLHFDILLHVGNSTVKTLTGTMFKPGAAWTKSRSATWNNVIRNAIRGAARFLYTNTTSAEVLAAGAGDYSFNSDGMSLGASAEVNNNSDTYVNWLFNVPDTAVANTDGSISSQVAANRTAGFSVVVYTGNGVNGATVGHGLGKVPSLIIEKDLTAGTYAWSVQGCGKLWTPATSGLFLNASSALNPSQIAAAPTSSVLTPSNTAYANVSGNLNVAYCFAEIEGFSKFGTYTGNGNADGPFVWCGFMPRFILAKQISGAGGNWIIVDTVRRTINVIETYLNPNQTSAETSGTTLFDIVSNGFKPRSTNFNTSGEIYAFMTIGEQTLKYATAR